MAAKVVLRWLSTCTLGMLLSLAAVPGGAAQANLVVSATVLKHARLRLLTQPPSLVITPADIGRGYLDVAIPTELAIQSNSLNGYAIEFASSNEFVRRISVLGLAGEVQLSPAGGVVTRATADHGMSTTTLRLGFRFTLDEAARAGTYPWPMQLCIVPL